MRRFIQNFKIPLVIIIGFIILGVIIILNEKLLPQSTSELPQQAEGSIPLTTFTETPPLSELKEKESTQQLATVTFIVDGDTVEIQTGERVRLIGIDAPERDRPYYAESKNKLSELVLSKEVRMEKDISNQDQYGRLLRYLWVGDTLVNLEMVRQGLASVFTYPPDVKYSEYFLEAQQEARRNLQQQF